MNEDDKLVVASENVRLSLENRKLREKNRALVSALRLIKDTEGKVCDEFEICAHRACNSSYSAWAIADEALVKHNGEKYGI